MEYAMCRRRIGLVGFLVFAAGCSREDADTLARIGEKLASRAKVVAPVKTGKDKLTVALPTFGEPVPAEQHEK